MALLEWVLNEEAVTVAVPDELTARLLVQAEVLDVKGRLALACTR